MAQTKLAEERNKILKAYVLESFGLENLKLQSIDDPTSPNKGEVLIQFKNVSINYRDTLVIAGKYDPRFPLPMVPLSDGAGVVLEVGEGVTDFKVGDSVITAFAPEWRDGIPRREEFRNSLGGPLDGTMREFGVFSAKSIVKSPSNLSLAQSSSLPCAALTAWSALMEANPILPGQTVLVQGTGGVSLFALQIAKKLGAKVICLSSSPDKFERARDLGADFIISTKEFPEWGKEARKITEKRGVDHIIEIGGMNTLSQSISASSSFGTISLIGVLGGNSMNTNLLPVVMNQIRMQGIVVGSVRALDRMCRAIEVWDLKPVLEPVLDWSDAIEVLKEFPKGKHFGKVVMEIT